MLLRRAGLSASAGLSCLMLLLHSRVPYALPHGVNPTWYITRSDMIDMTLIRPLNKGQGHFIWYQSISMYVYWLSIVTFCSRSSAPFSHNIHFVQITDRQIDRRSTVA